MKFNIFTKAIRRIQNHEGAPAFRMTPAMELYSTVATSGLSDTFYEKESKRIERLRTLIAGNDPALVARLAVYAREKMNLRSVPLVLTVELARIHKGDNLVSRLTQRVVQRADEITELLAYYQAANERSGLKKLNGLSKQLQKGLAGAFNKFDEFQFAKYNRAAEVKLRDALFLVHPKAASEAQQSLFNKIAADMLEVPYTWEVELSRLGQQSFDSAEAKAEAFRAKWEELIFSGKLGYMALLRNLRNILEAGINAEALRAVTSRLADAKEVQRSRQLPFRFLSAYREVKSVASFGTTSVLNALEAAIKVSAANIRGFDEKTRVVIACDVSGSMGQPVSPKSKVLNFDIGLVLAMLLQSRSRFVISGIFGDTWKVINLPQDGILANVEALYKRANEVGYSTNGYLVIEDLIRTKIRADKVMIFTDCQLWNSNGNGRTFAASWETYRRKVAPDAKLYLFDLAGYGQSPVDMLAGQNAALIAGWSDKVFDVLAAIENGESALSEIEKIEL